MSIPAMLLSVGKRGKTNTKNTAASILEIMNDIFPSLDWFQVTSDVFDCDDLRVTTTRDLQNLVSVLLLLSEVEDHALAKFAHQKMRICLTSLMQRDPNYGGLRTLEILSKPEFSKFSEELLKGPPTQLAWLIVVHRAQLGTLSLACWLKQAFQKHLNMAAFACSNFIEKQISGTPKIQCSPVVAQSLYRAFLEEVDVHTALLSNEASQKVLVTSSKIEKAYPSLSPSRPRFEDAEIAEAAQDDMGESDFDDKKEMTEPSTPTTLSDAADWPLTELVAMVE